MAKNYKQFNLLEVADISGVRVPKFEGTKKYIATADIDSNQIISGTEVTYEDRPSRADLMMKQDEVLFAKMKSTKKVLLGSSEIEDCIFSTGFYILKPKENISKKYLYFFLLSNNFNSQKDSFCSGATMAAIGNAGLKKIQISIPVNNKGIPDLNEQKRIASLLEEAERLQKKRVGADQKMNEVIPALFKEMFGDPVTNEKKWKTGVLGDVIFSAKDGPHVSPKYSDENGIPFLSSRHIKPGSVVWNDLKFITLEEAQIQWKKCKPEKGDVLYTKGGTTGIAATITFDNPIAVWVHVALLKVDHKKVNPIWLETMLNSSFCYKQSQELTRGIANRDLGLSRMKTIKIFIPPIELQNKFVEKSKMIARLRIKQKESAVKIDNLFTSLLSNSLTK